MTPLIRVLNDAGRSFNARSLAVRGAVSAAAVVLMAALVAGCGSAGSTGSAGPSGSAAPGFPVSVTDCSGVRSVVTAPPRRVVTLTSSVLEPLFWLGVADRVVGQGTPPKPGTFPPQFDAAAQQIPKLAGDYSPGSYKPVPKEQLLGTTPDLVLGGFPSNFTTAGAASQQDLAAAGIASYLTLSTSCQSALSGPQTTLDLVYRDLDNLSRVFGVPERGQQLIAGVRAKTDQVRVQVAGSPAPTVFPFEFDEGVDTPVVPGNRQTVNAVITMAGGHNIFADLDKAYEKVGWEEIAKRNPQVIAIIVYDKGNDAANQADIAKAEQFLRTYPPAASIDAVRNQRFVSLIYEESSVGGVRNGEAVVSLARQLHPGQVG